MTSSHKIVLSLIAAICITLIVFYSVKGNSAQPGAPAQQPRVASSVPTASNADKRAETPAAATGREKAPAGIDEIMARVKQLEETSSTEKNASAAVGAASDKPTANAPAATTATNTIADAGATGTTPAATSGTAATAPADKPATSEPSPFDAAPSVNATAGGPAANTIAEVPSLTLGAPKKEAVGEAAPAKTNSDSREFGDLAIIDDAIPPLAKIDEPATEPSPKSQPPLAEASKTGGETAAATTDEPAAPANTGDATNVADKTVASAAKPATTTTIDPHQPAVKATQPATNTPTTDKAETASATKPAAPATPAAPAKSGTDTPAAESARLGTTSNIITPPTNTYTLRPGDTFSSIATALYGAEKYWIEIADANPAIDPKKVRAGQVIKLPVIDKDDLAPATKTPAKTDAKVDAKTDSKAPAKVESKTDAKTATKVETKTDTPSSTAAAAEPRIHEVKAGENLSSISRRYFNTPDHWRHIYLTNRDLIGGDPGKLHAGLKLKITAPAKEN